LNPTLTAICTAYPTPPDLPVLHRPIQLATRRPRRSLNLDRWIDFPAICLGTPPHLIAAEIYI
jgi:hypothetical protein